MNRMGGIWASMLILLSFLSMQAPGGVPATGPRTMAEKPMRNVKGEDRDMKSDKRPLLSRNDLARLKKVGRAELFGVFGSFDEAGLNERDFVLRTAELLDPARVPGLTEAVAARDSTRIADAVMAACTAAAGRPAPRSDPATLPATVLKLADDALEHRFTFYEETHQLPASIDWDHNPGTKHWGHDLNRFSYLNALTRAYVATGQTAYSRQAIDLILDWIGKCDMAACFTGTPYVFGSYLNEAIHCLAWSHCVRTLLAHDQVEPIELMRILKSLHDQLAYLEIVTNGHGGNWPTIGFRGMLGTMAALPVFRDIDRFVDYCTRNLSEQIDDQVLPDGVQDELTPGYHRCVLHNLFTAIESLRALGAGLDPRTLAVLKKMIHYAQQTSLPDNSGIAGFNDSDPASGTNLRPRLDALGLTDYFSPPARLGPEVFPYAGVAFLRQRPADGDLYLAFDAGPYGRGHQHEDRLGFCLFAYGRSLLVDPGRHLYDWSEVSYYDYLRSTTAHSTIKVDGLNQHSAGRRDTWIAQEPLDLGWSVTAEDMRARGVYDLGYGDENAVAVVHRREIVFVRERFWVVFDVLEGAGEHGLESRFQFAPGRLIEEPDGRVRTDNEDGNLLLWPLASAPITDRHVECGQKTPRGGWYSPRYGRIEPAPALSLALRARLPVRMVTLLYPYKSTTVPTVAFGLDGDTAVVATDELGEVRVTPRL